MSISVAKHCLHQAQISDRPAERLGLLTTAQELLKEAIKATKRLAIDDAAGQENLPMGTPGR